MFRVSTLDLANRDAIPRTPDGRIDFAQDFFGKEAFLTVSGQLNVETYCLALSKVYTFGPTFRAENSNTSRHLAEFWMVEPEIAFADLNDDADLAEAFLKYIFTALLAERGDDMKFFADRIDKDCIARLERFVDVVSFERMTYTEAIAALEKSGKKFEFPVRWGIDLQSEHERWLTEEHVKAPGRRHELPEGDQGLLHAHERRREDRRGDGRAGAGHRRDHRRLAARGAARLLDRRLAELNLDPKALLVVPRPAPLRHRAARRLRSGPRAHDHLRHGHGQHPRRDSVSADARQRIVLIASVRHQP